MVTRMNLKYASKCSPYVSTEHPILHYPNHRLMLNPLMDRTWNSYRKMVFHSSGMVACEPAFAPIPAALHLFLSDRFCPWPSAHWVAWFFQPPLDCTDESFRLFETGNKRAKLEEFLWFIFAIDETNLLSEIHQILITSRAIQQQDLKDWFYSPALSKWPNEFRCFQINFSCLWIQ